MGLHSITISGRLFPQAYFPRLEFNDRLQVVELMVVVDSAFIRKYSDTNIHGGVTLYLATILSMMANLYRYYIIINYNL